MLDLNEIFVPEADYPAEMQTRVMPYIGARRSDGYFAGYDGNPSHYVRYACDAPKATVIISHGFTESAEKWHETAYYLLNFGYDVYIIEHRGHALSHRSVADKTLTHIDRFDEYVRDFALFVDLVRAERQTDLYLLAHSMGCAIGLLYLESRPEAFKKVFLSSPMIMPSTGGIPAWCGRFITRAAIIFGNGKKRAFVSGVYPGDEKFEDSAKTSRARFDERGEGRGGPGRKVLERHGASFLRCENDDEQHLERGDPADRVRRTGRDHDGLASGKNVRDAVDDNLAGPLERVDHGVAAGGMAAHALVRVDREERDLGGGRLRKREAVHAAFLYIDEVG